MPPSQNLIGGKPSIRNIENPESIPYFCNVSRIWHFQAGDVLLERERKRDCLVPDVDVVDVSTSGDQRIEGVVAIEAEGVVEITQRGDTRTLSELDLS